MPSRHVLLPNLAPSSEGMLPNPPPKEQKAVFSKGVFFRVVSFRGWPGSTRAEGTKLLESTVFLTHVALTLTARLMAPYRAILRYYRCDSDTPYGAILFEGGLRSPEIVRYPPWYLVSQRHIYAIPHFATYCAITVKATTKEFAILSLQVSHNMKSIGKNLIKHRLGNTVWNSLGPTSLNPKP